MSKQKQNNNFFLRIAAAIFILIGLPLFCYLAVKELSKGKVKMPRYYGIERIDSADSKKPDTVYHKINDLVLTNQLGQQVSLNNYLKGKILVIDFFFTTCPSVCPRLTENMRVLQNSFKKDPKKEESLEDNVAFVSITIDPAHDSFPALRAYADRHGANPDHWWFLTGDKKTIYNFARNELHLPVGPGDGGADDFIHTEKLTLLDTDRYIRGYYNGLDNIAVRKCADDIVLLTMEWKHKK
jgi:protein SCO1/2